MKMMKYGSVGDDNMQFKIKECRNPNNIYIERRLEYIEGMAIRDFELIVCLIL